LIKAAIKSQQDCYDTCCGSDQPAIKINSSRWNLSNVPASLINKGARIFRMSGGHLTALQIDRLWAKRLSDDELTAVASHIAECEYCDNRSCEELRRKHTLPSRFTEDQLAFCLRNCHVEFESLMSLAEGTLDSEVQWLFGLHLKTCECCAEDLKECERCLEEDRNFLTDPSRDDDWSN